MTFSPCSIAPLTKSSVADVFATASACRASVMNASSCPRFRGSAASGERAHAVVALSREERQDLLDRPRACARGHSDRQPRSQLRRQRQDVVLRSAQHDAVQLDRELVDVRRAAGLPAELAFLRRAVALREREEAAPERVFDQLQQHEEIARPARERCAGQQLDRQRLRRVRARARREIACELAARAGVVLQIVGLVEHQRRPGHLLERVSMPAEDVVIDDDPCRASGRPARCPRSRGWTHRMRPARSRGPSFA